MPNPLDGVQNMVRNVSTVWRPTLSISFMKGVLREALCVFRCMFVSVCLSTQ